jgi:CDP-glucose 4,6-dehydratase
VEVLGLKLFGGAYEGRKVLVTGHTGFKGSWLSLWLHTLGAEVIGVALNPPTEPNHWDLLTLPTRDYRVDIRNRNAIASIFAEQKPHVVFHLAAQPLVRRSYSDPIATWSTNVLGTAHVLEAIRLTSGVSAVVVVTSDKCYENREWPWAYRELDRLGGHDPYSASKASAELVVASYRSAFLQSTGGTLVATARGGNVIGGGDWSEDRLIPDLVRAVAAGEPLKVRSPASRRPWQHVLDCLSGYLRLGQRLIERDGTAADAWNFGPKSQDSRTVEYVLERLAADWPQLNWVTDTRAHPHEAGILQIDSSKAEHYLQWNPVWNLDAAIRNTAAWYRDWADRSVISSRSQLQAFVSDANKAKAQWSLGIDKD